MKTWLRQLKYYAIALFIPFITMWMFIDVFAINFWKDNLVKNVENKKVIIIPYENKTNYLIKNFLTQLKYFYWKFDTAVINYDNKKIWEDKNLEKLLSYYKKEKLFINKIEKLWIKLTDWEKKAFFKFIWEWKAINEIKNKEKEKLTKIVSLRKWDDDTFYKLVFDQLNQSLLIMELIDGIFQTIYGWKLEIPLDALIYDVKLIYSKDNKVPYLITKFLTLNGIWTSVMSLSMNTSNWQINLVSDVSWIYINNTTNYFAYKQSECDQKLKYFNVDDNWILHWYCLSKENLTLLSHILIK